MLQGTYLLDSCDCSSRLLLGSTDKSETSWNALQTARGARRSSEAAAPGRKSGAEA